MEDCPEAFLCPITSVCFFDPVFCEDGHTYERSALESWFKQADTSPMTRQVLNTEFAIPNLNLKSQIEAWRVRGKSEAATQKILQRRLSDVLFSEDITQLTRVLKGLKEFLLARDAVLPNRQLRRLRLSLQHDEKLWCNPVPKALEDLEAQCEASINSNKEQLMRSSMLQRVAEQAMFHAQIKNLLLLQKELTPELEADKKAGGTLQDDIRREFAQENYTKCLQLLSPLHKQRTCISEQEIKDLQPVMKDCHELHRIHGIYTKEVEMKTAKLKMALGTAETMLDIAQGGGTTSPGEKQRMSKRKHGACDADKDVKQLTNKRPKYDASALYVEGIEWWHGDKFRVMDERRGQMLIEVAANLGDASAEAHCMWFGWEGRTRDVYQAHKRFFKIAEEGKCFYAMWKHADSLRWTDTDNEENKEKAAELHRKAAEQGSCDSQNSLGHCYQVGDGVPRCLKTAVEWYTKAAEQGHSSAQVNLGTCYITGYGVGRNAAKAVEWYTHAAEQGHTSAQHRLALCYMQGDGVAVDKKKSVEWYEKAAEQGDMNAQYNLAVCYLNGEGVTMDKKKAVESFEKLAKQGQRDAQSQLAICYTQGDGVTKDEKKAAEWEKRVAEPASWSL